jgi:hypothetical protein
MKIFCKNAFIEITSEPEALRLEVLYNLTERGKLWSFIGDALYYFRDVEVRDDQFRFMVNFVNQNHQHNYLTRIVQA